MVKSLSGAAFVVVLLAISATAYEDKKETTLGTAEAGAKVPAVLWRSPDDLESRNLLYGMGGEEHQPRGPFTFVEEDLEGTNPKFDVRDQDGVKWKVKLGAEARSEVVASRF